VLTHGRIRLDVGARECTVDGRQVELTAKELAILEYLMRRADEVVSKSEVICHVWDFAYEGGENVVEVHVSALRRKLGVEAIDTVRGGGYRMGSSAR
ncbi:MAG: winged helix-turn-helix domain-containing protein, partial [Ilumatobacteraceae bacterium]